MKVRFKKNWTNERGKKILKGAEEGFVNEKAIMLIEKGYAERIVEFEDTGSVDVKGEQILKEKKNADNRNV